MDTQNPTPTTQDKPITVDVPEARIPEFYALYARFLAGPTGRGPRGRRRGGPRHHGHGHRHCGPGFREEHDSREEARHTPEAPAAETTPAETGNA